MLNPTAGSYAVCPTIQNRFYSMKVGVLEHHPTSLL